MWNVYKNWKYTRALVGIFKKDFLRKKRKERKAFLTMTNIPESLGVIHN